MICLLKVTFICDTNNAFLRNEINVSAMCESDITQFAMQRSVVTVNGFKSELPRFCGGFKPWVIATSGMERHWNHFIT